MFASPWNGKYTQNEKLKEALQTINTLNTKLSERTSMHLESLKRKRNGRNDSVGRNIFDVALINHMEYSNELKPEPMKGEARCSVSWHADSCLEHYSTIAVYHTIFNNDRCG